MNRNQTWIHSPTHITSNEYSTQLQRAVPTRQAVGQNLLAAILGCLLMLEITILLASQINPAKWSMRSSHSDEPTANTKLVASGSFTVFLPIIQRQTWRPFSDNSPWNTLIPIDPEIDPNSGAMINNLQSSSDPEFWINLNKYTVPVWVANASTPQYKVPCTDGNCHDFDHVPIPGEAVPDPEHDAHMLILDLAQHKSWDMWHAQKLSDGSWIAGYGTTFDLNGEGVKAYGQGSARGSGFPLAGGLIYAQEVQAGHIRHALIMAYDWPRNCVVYPASTSDGLSSSPNAIPEGARLQLDPSLDLNTLNLSPAAKVIARAMQEYGLYVGDNSHGISLYAESFYGKPTNPWAGLLSENDLSNIPIDRLRVLKLGQVNCAP